MKTLEVLLNPDGHLIAKDGVNAANPPGAGPANDDNKVDQAYCSIGNWHYFSINNVCRWT